MVKKEYDKRNIFKIVTMIYFIISPIFDMVFLYNHTTTLIRVFALMLFLLITLVLYEDSRKKFKFLLLYYLLMAIYLAISYFHSQGFESYIPGNINYSIVTEASALIKLSMPFTIMFIMKFQEYSKKDFFRVINSWVLIIAGSIVICNLIGFSLSSYTDEITRYSIFSWGDSLSVRDTATKGFFAFANQEAIVLILLLVLTIYELLFENKKSIILVALIMFACLMLGTRISTYGGILVILAILILYLIHSLLYKRRISVKIIWMLPIIVAWFLLIPISPNSDRMEEMQTAQESSHIDENEAVEKPVDSSSTSDTYIEQNINQDLVGKQFYLEYYPYQYDLEFWNNVIEVQNKETMNYRKLEIMIIDRIVEVDNRALNFWFGISYSRIQNVVNIERDFVLHFYAYGIIGSLITLLYYTYSLIDIIKKFNRIDKFVFTINLASLFLFVFCSYLSGNSLNFLATIVPFAFIMSFLRQLEIE